MVQQSYSVSVPGSLVLMGEHTVLVNKHAIICGVNKRMRIKLTPDSSQKVKLMDTKLGLIEQDLDKIEVQAPFQYVTAVIKYFAPRIKTGFTIAIDSDFSSVLGLGSSAAVTVASVAVVANWVYKKPLSAEKILKIAKEIMLSVQGFGSGADLAASLYGGVIHYRSDSLKCDRLPTIPGLTAVYCGYKKPTKEVLDIINAAKSRQPEVYSSIFTAMHVCVKQAVKAIKRGDILSLGQLFMHHQGLQVALGVSNRLLDTLIAQLLDYPEIFAAKISGAGLGDCVIGLGTLREGVFPIDEEQQKQGVMQIPVTISLEGLKYEHN